MKIRNFYPKSVIRKLHGKEFNSITPGENAALKYATYKSRKLGIQIAITQHVTGLPLELKDAAAIMFNNPLKILVLSI